MKQRRIEYADDDVTPLLELIRLRTPSLLIGLVLGVVLSLVTSQFEEVLAQNVKVVFFIPFVVYMADAVGTQTQNIYARDLRGGKASFKKYLIKETLLGLILGVTTGILAMSLVGLWLGWGQLALAVGLGVCGAIMSAPIIALLITEALELERLDPAVGAGPIATVIQDTVSVVIYGMVATWILL